MRLKTYLITLSILLGIISLPFSIHASKRSIKRIPQALIFPVEIPGFFSASPQTRLIWSDLEGNLKSHYRLLSQDDFFKILNEEAQTKILYGCNTIDCYTKLSQVFEIHRIFVATIKHSPGSTHIQLSLIKHGKTLSEEVTCSSCKLQKVYKKIPKLVRSLYRKEVRASKKDSSSIQAKQYEALEQLKSLLQAEAPTGDIEDHLELYDETYGIKSLSQVLTLAPPLAYQLGRFFRVSDEFDRSDSYAFYWYLDAAERGEDRAQNNLGYLYYQGIGTPKNIRQAIFWYEEASKQNNAQAKYNLGSLYQSGIGVTKTPEKALQFFRDAATLGHKKAQELVKLLDKKKK